MANKINNPFLSGGQNPQAQAPTPDNTQQAQATPHMPSQPQQPQQPTGQMPPAGQPMGQSPFMQSPFAQQSPQQPQQQTPQQQMPQQQLPQGAQPPQSPQQPAATALGQSPFAQAPIAQPQANQPQVSQPQVSQPPVSQPPVSQPIAPSHSAPQQPQQTPQPQQQMPQAPMMGAGAGRVTAADPVRTPQVKKPSPFDFAPQVSGAGGGASQAAATNPSGQTPRYTSLRFTGGVGQLYGIMIINYFLTLFTLGIWAPWAKVRTMRYFYGHTEFLDHGLEFLATGKQLFVGRVIAILVLIAIGFFEFVPFIGPALAVIIIIAGIPYVLNRSIGFKARFLAWRDVRFDWQGSYGKAFLIFTILPLLSFFTLGLAQPVAARALRKHYADNHAFGAASFSADLSLGSYYLALLKAILFFIIITLLLGGPAGFLGLATLTELGLFEITSVEELTLIFAFLTQAQQLMLVLPIVAAIFAFYMASSFYLALSRHIMVNNLRLHGGIRFRSKLSGFRFAMIMLTNLFINILTLGFAYPYTIIRRYRYLVESIEIRPIANMAGFIDHQQKSGFSVFEEASDIEGLSIDI